MRIEFDASNDTELTAVFVALAVLRGGDLSLPLLDDERDQAHGSTSDFIPPAPPAAAVPAPPAVAPVPPVPAAPPAPPAPPAAPAGVDVDTAGLPYDKRIHSSPATKKKDGHWRQKRGVDPALVAQVEAELRQAMAAPAPAAVPVAQGGAPAADMAQALEQSRAHLTGEGAPAVPPPPSEPAVDAATAFGADGAAAASSPAPAAPVPPAPPATPAAPAAPATGITFADLMRKITGLQTAGTLTVEGTQQIAQSLGITGVRDLMHRPDLISSFDALLPSA